MSSRKANSQFNLATRPSIPTRFRCVVGGEWKPLDEFSQNQQQRFIQRPIGGRHGIDPANTGMTCREHTPGQRTEMTCALCGLVKPVDEFSLSSKRNENAHCKRCTAWVETQEPEVVPAPLETGHISIEEQRGEMWPTKFIDSTDFFSDDILPQAPVTGLSSLGLEDLDGTSSIDVDSLLSASSTYGEAAERRAASRHALPPHLAGKIPGSTDKAASAKASSKTAALNQLPPHLRSVVQLPDEAPDRAVSSEYSYDSMSTATTAREAKAAKPRKVSFNAWDAKGMAHRGMKAFTASSTARTSAAASATASEAGEGSSRDPGPQASQVKAKWVKNKDVMMSQTELRQVGTNHHVAARQVGPVKHHPPQHDFSKFCEPDDDDDETW